MSRLVEAVEKGTVGPTGWAAVRLYGERVAKYVPAEVLALYTAIVLAFADKPNATLRFWASFVIWGACLLLTPYWLGRFSKDQDTKWTNQVMGTAAFIIWSYGYPKGWFVEAGVYDATTGAVLVALFTFFSGFNQPEKPKEPDGAKP